MKTKILLLFCAITIIGCKSSYNSGQYKLTTELQGLGCIRLGSSLQEVSESIDSSYKANISLLRKNYIQKSKMLQKEKLMYYSIPEKYTSDYCCYQATIVISEDLIVEKAMLYFWKDTLTRIWINNSNAHTRDVGNALIWKYGAGEGYCNKTSNRERLQYLWGNDFCIAKYTKNVTYIIGENGLAKGISSSFQEVDVSLNNQAMQQRITNYLHKADSLWNANKYNEI